MSQSPGAGVVWAVGERTPATQERTPGDGRSTMNRRRIGRLVDALVASLGLAGPGAFVLAGLAATKR